MARLRLAALLALVLTIPARAQAQAPPDAPITVRPLRFSLTAAVVQGLSDQDIARRLSAYVDDLNTVFGAQTRRRFSFDPATGVAVYPDRFAFPDSASTPEFDILMMDAIVFPGTAGIAGGGQVELYGITRLLDPEDLSAPQDADDYLRYQFANLVHELEHSFGAGNGEFYLDLQITDTSNRVPLLNVNFADPIDPYWSQRREYAGDPLAMAQFDNPFLGFPRTRAAVLAATRFTRGTVAVINRDPAPFYPFSSSTLTVTLIDKVTGQPITAPGQLLVYASNPSFTLTSPQTIAFASGAAVPVSYLPATGQRAQLEAHRRLIKAFVPGYVAAGGWHTINDQFEDLYVDGKPTGDLVIRLSPLTAPGPTVGAVTPPDGTHMDPQAPSPITVPVAASQGLRSVEVRNAAGQLVCAGRYADSTLETVFTCLPFFEGPHGTTATLTVVATDHAGKSASTTVSYVIDDRTGPDGNILPNRTLVHSSETIDVLVQTSDLSGVSRAELLLKTSPTSLRTLTTMTFAPAVAAPEFTYAWKVPSLFSKSTGQVTLVLRVRDSLGNTREWQAPVTIDNVAPFLRVLSPTPSTTVAPGATVDIVTESSDAFGIDFVEVFAHGRSVCYNPVAPFTCSVVADDEPGDEDYTVKVADLAGNLTKTEVVVRVRR